VQLHVHEYGVKVDVRVIEDKKQGCVDISFREECNGQKARCTLYVNSREA
jgi:hypothetical protein